MTRRRLKATCVKMMARFGTTEPVVEEFGHIAVHWRKPLTLAEINQMAPTEDVRLRRGRP
jgi:hypothetical protein